MHSCQPSRVFLNFSGSDIVSGFSGFRCNFPVFKNMMQGGKMGKKKSNTVHFWIHIFQTGHGYFLGACMEYRFRTGDSTCCRLRRSLAGEKKQKGNVAAIFFKLFRLSMSPGKEKATHFAKYFTQGPEWYHCTCFSFRGLSSLTPAYLQRGAGTSPSQTHPPSAFHFFTSLGLAAMISAIGTRIENLCVFVKVVLGSF